MPNLWFVRPGDANETLAAWALAAERGSAGAESLGERGPVALSLTRQKLPTLEGTADEAWDGVYRGGYVLREGSRGADDLDLILIGTGSELQLCVAAADALEQDGIATRVVSLPCWERFDAQDQAYRDSVLPPAVRKRVSVEAGVPLGWERWVGDEGAIVGLDHFGASAPAKTIFEHLGFTDEHVADVARKVVREGFHGRVPSPPMEHAAPHGSHPSLGGDESGVDRTGGSDPGHD
jgi:transketolase